MKPLVSRLLLGLLLLSPLTARGVDTAPVSGTVLLPSGQGADHSYVRFELQYCGGNAGVIVGVGTIVTSPFDVQTATGVWSSPIYGNDRIMCGTTTNNSRWKITPYINGAAGPAHTYWIKSATAFDIDGAPGCPVNSPPTVSCVMDYLPTTPPPFPTSQGPVTSVFGLAGDVCVPSSLCTPNSSKFDLSGSGEVDVPTPATNDNSNKAASTAFVKAAVASGGGGGGGLGSGSGYIVSSIDLPNYLRFSGTTSLALTAVNLGSTAADVYVVRISVPVPVTVSTITGFFTAAGGTGSLNMHYSFGLYNSAGTTKLIDSGVMTYLISSTAALWTKSYSSVALAAGTYWFAFTQDTIQGGQSSWLGVAFNNQVTGVQYAYINAMMNQISTKLGVAANQSTAGVLPATLGTISPVKGTGTSGSGPQYILGVPWVIFE